jgi:plastocyanin
MHHLAMQLAPVLAAEKSKLPFYLAGGLLVAWALIVSLALGMRRPDFPGNLAGVRAVIAITAVLVIAAVGTAVLTSGSSPTAKAASPPARVAANPSVPAAGAPASSSASASTGTAPAGNSEAKPAPAAAGKLKLAADPAGLLSFDTKQLSAKAGAASIAFTNSSQVEHNLTIAQGSVVTGATPTFTGGAKTLTVNLKPGTYTFYCSVPGHRQAGMEGTLKVT